ncbi:MAG: phage terminase large subunit [Candidatus Thiodiazotropha endolucinida]
MEMQNDQLIKELESHVKKDFKAFLGVVWDSLGLTKPTPLQLEIAEYLQNAPSRTILQAFRGAGKSFIAGAFVCWSLLRNRHTKILVVSATKDRADEFAKFTFQLFLTLRILNSLAPQSQTRRSQSAFDVNGVVPDQMPSVKSIGLTGQLTGSRADLIIADDIEVLNNSYTQGLRQKARKSVEEFDSIIKPADNRNVKPRIIYLGTPQSLDSIYNHLETRGYQTRIWPAYYPKLDELALYKKDRLAPSVVKAVQNDPTLQLKSTEPHRFSNRNLKKRELSLGKSTFELQFLLRTNKSDRDKYPLRTSDLIIRTVDNEIAPESFCLTKDKDFELNHLPHVGLNDDCFYKPSYVNASHRPYEKTIMAIDPSGRGKNETAYAVLKTLNGNAFLADCGGFIGGYEESTLTRLTDLVPKYNISQIVIESNFGGGMYEKLLKETLRINRRSTHIVGVRASGKKKDRIINTLEPILNNHKLIVDPAIIEKEYAAISASKSADSIERSLIRQMTHMTHHDAADLRYDDRIDALAMGIQHLQASLARDAANAAEAHMEAEYSRLTDLYFGFAEQTINWRDDYGPRGRH